MHQDIENEQRLGVLLSDRQGALLDLNIGEIGETVEMCAQVPNRKRAAKEIPALLLQLINPAQGVEKRDAGITPIQQQPIGDVGSGAIENSQALLSATGTEEVQATTTATAGLLSCQASN